MQDAGISVMNQDVRTEWEEIDFSSWGVVLLFSLSPFIICLKQLTDHWFSSQFRAANWMDNQWPVGFLRQMTNGDEWGRTKKWNNIWTHRNLQLSVLLLPAPFGSLVPLRSKLLIFLKRVKIEEGRLPLPLLKRGHDFFSLNHDTFQPALIILFLMARQNDQYWNEVFDLISAGDLIIILKC